MPVARELTFAPFRGSAAVAAGFVTRRQLDGLAWRRLYRDVYRRAGLDLDTLAWCYAAGLLLDDRGAVSGLSAAALWGADVCEPGAPVEMTVPPPVHLRPPPGLVIRRSPLDPADVSLRARTPVTSPVRTGYDIARCGNRVAAVVGLDALLSRRLFGIADVARYALARPGWRGSAAVGPVLALADAGAESPMETRLRLVLVDGGLPRPVVQHEVRDAGGLFVARLDLAYPAHRLGIEYEGDHHRGRGVFAYDLRRINALKLLGWRVLRFGPADVYRNAAGIVSQVRTALA